MNVELIAQTSFTFRILGFIRTKRVFDVISSCRYPDIDILNEFGRALWTDIYLPIPSIAECNNSSPDMSIRYFVLLNVKVAGNGLNCLRTRTVKIKIPITIGTESIRARINRINLARREPPKDVKELVGRLITDAASDQLVSSVSSSLQILPNLSSSLDEFVVIPECAVDQNRMVPCQSF